MSLTRPLLPQGVIRDNAPPNVYPALPSFSPGEMAANYWRVRYWRAYGRAVIGDLFDRYEYTRVAWNFDLTFPANTRLRPDGFDPRFEVALPEFYLPTSEEDLTRTYGTYYSQYFTTAITNTFRNPDDLGDPLTNYTIVEPEELVATLRMNTEIQREWDDNDWKQSRFTPDVFFYVGRGGLYGTEGDFGLAGSSLASPTDPYPATRAPMLLNGPFAPRNLFCVGSKEGFLDFTAEGSHLTIEPAPNGYWGYNGKFDIGTGKPIK